MLAIMGLTGLRDSRMRVLAYSRGAIYDLEDLRDCAEQTVCLAVAWNVHRSSYPVYTETILVHFQDGGGVVGVTNPACLFRGFVLQKCKRDPIYPSRDKKWQQKSTNPAPCPPMSQGVIPPGWPLISAFVPGYFAHIVQVEQIGIIAKKEKLHFQVTFSLPSSLLKLPGVERGRQTASTSFNIRDNKRNVEQMLKQGLNAFKLIQHG